MAYHKLRRAGRWDRLGVESLEDRRMLSVVPVASPDTYQAFDGHPLQVDPPHGLLANDAGDMLTAVLASGPTSGKLELHPDGSFSYTPNANFVGNDSFTYQAVDGSVPGAPVSSTATTVTLQVNPDPKGTIFAVNDFYGVVESTSLTTDAAHGVLTNDLAPPALQLSSAVVARPANGQLQLNADGSFTYTPNAGFTGVDQFTYKVTGTPTASNSGPSPTSGGTGGDADASLTKGDPPPAALTSNTATVTIAVLAPAAKDDFYGTTPGQALTVDATHGVLANDRLGSLTGTASLVANAINGSVTLNADGSFTYTPNANFTGADTFTYQDATSDGNTNVATVTVAVRPEEAVHAANDLYQVATGATLSIDAAHGVLQNDYKQPGATLTATLVSNPANGSLTLNADGSFTYTPNVGFTGADIFTYTASDGTNTSNTATVTIGVHPPAPPAAVIAVNDYFPVITGTTLTVDGDHGVLANDHFNHDSPPPPATLVSTTTNGSLTLNADGSFTYTPNANFTGLDAFTYTDGSGDTASNTATVVLQVQAAPTLHAANNVYSVAQNGTLTVGAERGVLANDAALPGTTLTAALVATTTSGSLTLNADGSFSYTPNTGFAGADTFSYTASDGTNTSNTAVVTIYVLPPKPQTPVAVDDFYAATTGTPLVVDAADGVLDNDLSKDGATLTATVVNQPANGTVTLNADGSFTYTPNAGFQGNDVFTYQDSDGTNTSNAAAVHVHVRSDAANPPLAVPDVYEVLENTTLTVDDDHGVLYNDFAGNGGTLTATLVANPANGTLTFQSDGSFTYTPTAGFTGNDSFTYTANNGTADSDPTTVTIHVHPPIALPPVAVSDTYATAPGQALTTDATHGVLANDIAANGATLTATVVAAPANGTLTLNTDGSFTYTPNAGYTGTDVFTYKANDGTTDSNVAAVFVHVTPKANGPIAFDDTYTATANAPLTVTAANGVLSNDHGSSLTATLLNTTVHGTLVFNSDGSFTYTPDATFQGTDVFSYTASDGQTTSNPALVVLTLHAWHNAADPDDVNSDGKVAPLDALNVINDLNANGIRVLPAVQANCPDALLDVNGDNMVSPLDVLTIVNALNDKASASTASAEPVAAVATPLAVTVSTRPTVGGGVGSTGGATSAGGSVTSSMAAATVSATPAQAAVTQVFASFDAPADGQTAALDAILSDLAADVSLARKK